MTDDKKLDKAEALRGLWADLEAERLQEEEDERLQKEAESMTEEQLIAAEKADGSHEAMERAYANVDKAFAEAHAKAARRGPARPQSETNVVDIRSAKRWSTVSVVTSGLTAFVAAACLVLVLGKLNRLPGGVYPTPTSTVTAGAGDHTQAREAFQSGLRYCAVDDYTNCLRALDYAKELDPDIVGDGAWGYCHAKATRFLELQKKKGGP